MQVISRQGDTVDSLCWQHLGSTDAVEQVLALNPGLAALGPVLPMGTVVTLPDPATTTPTTQPTINLWD